MMRATEAAASTAKLFAIVATLLVVFGLVGVSEGGVIDTNETNDADYFGIKIYPIERLCAMVGGICVHHDDCAEGTSTQGLCGRNRHLGVECCYSVVPQPTTCQKLLGACMSQCNPEMVRDQATDCGPDQQCCLLV